MKRQDRQRQKLAELQHQWQDLSDRIGAIVGELGVTTGAEQKLVLTKRRQALEAERDALESQMQQLEAALEAIPTPPAGTRHVGPLPVATRPAGLPGPTRQRWALLVGINRYVDPTFPPLRFCVNDVLALEQALKRLGYVVVALHDDATEERLLPTRDNVEAELARLCQAAGRDDLLLAHFACHGKLADGQPVFITRETRAPTPAKKALPLAEVERAMRASQARRLVLTLDACHAGVEIGRDLADPAFIRNAYDLAEGFALIAASTAQQVAQEWDEKEHGVFTYYLLEGLSGQADSKGKSFVTVDDLKTYVLDGLRRWNVEHGGLLQEPTARTEGLGDMILADYRRAAPSPPSSQPAGQSIGPNPFGDRGRISEPGRFFDRQQLVREIQQLLVNGSSVSLVGPSEIGKSSLLYYLYRTRAEWLPDTPVEYFDLQRILDEEDLCETVLDRLGQPGRTLRDLKRVLESESVVLLFDEVERLAAPEFHPRLHDLLRSLAQELAVRVVVSTQRPLVEVFPPRGQTSPFHNVFHPKQIGPLSPAEARAFLERRLAGTGIDFTAEEMNDLITHTGGHPARLQEAAYHLFAEKE
jgi:hypothetical protein